MLIKQKKGDSLDAKGKKWGKTIEKYFQASDVTNEVINFPALIRTLGNIRNKIILDFGCGNGRFSSQLAKMGAQKVIGIDKENSMIHLARKINPSARIEYYTNPGNKLAFLNNNSIDIVVANLVFMMSSRKEFIHRAFKEIFRVMKPNGLFVYLITHPSFIERGAPDYRNQFDNTFDYFDEGQPYRFILFDHRGKEIDEEFYDYHYTISTYLNMAVKNNFTIIGVKEVGWNNPSQAKKYKIQKKFQTFPQSLIIAAKKLRA